MEYCANISNSLNRLRPTAHGWADQFWGHPLKALGHYRGCTRLWSVFAVQSHWARVAKVVWNYCFLPVTKLQRSNVHLMPLDSVHVTLPDCWDLIKQTQGTDWSRYKYNATPNWGWGQPAGMWWLSLSPCVRPCWRSGSIVRRVFLPRSLMMTNGRQ